jgi:hypothetical protein
MPEQTSQSIMLKQLRDTHLRSEIDIQKLMQSFFICSMSQDVDQKLGEADDPVMKLIDSEGSRELILMRLTAIRSLKCKR